MDSKVFRGKNWKLASERKWLDEGIDKSTLGERVGSLVIGEKEYDVFPITDGFAAVEAIKEVAQKEYWVVNAAGGNVNRKIAARDENEACRRLEQICLDFNTVGVLYLVKEDGSSEKIASFDGHSK